MNTEDSLNLLTKMLAEEHGITTELKQRVELLEGRMAGLERVVSALLVRVTKLGA